MGWLRLAAISLEWCVPDDPELLSELRWAESKFVPLVISFCVGVGNVVREEGKDDREVWRSTKVLELATMSITGGPYGRVAAILGVAARKGGV